MQVAQLKFDGVQLPAWHSHPVWQSSLLLHAGRQALPEMSGAHFHGLPPHSSTEVHAPHASPVVVWSGLQVLLTVSQW